MRDEPWKINLSYECEEFDERLPLGPDYISVEERRRTYSFTVGVIVDSNVKTKIVQHFFFQNLQPLRERDGFFSKLMYFVIYIS